MTSHIPLIEAFIAAWNRLDMDAITGMMAPDIFYHNIPLEPCRGVEAFRAFMAQLPAKQAHWTLHAIAENGDRVLTERTDNFVLADGRPLSIRVMGIFEIADGRIAQWRDYFDLAEMNRQLA